MNNTNPPLPFSRVNQLNDQFDGLESSDPSQHPTCQLRTPKQPDLDFADETSTTQFLERDLLCRELDTIANRLWTLSTPWSGNVNPLHKQKILGREICVTEEPRLHLLWIGNKIFIKPLPAYLLSAVFWQKILLEPGVRKNRAHVSASALGLLRSYSYLIGHESDLRIAQLNELRLIPANADWDQICRFLAEVSKISDKDVSGRYLYGELRLSRLNLYAPLLLEKLVYQRVNGPFVEYFARLFAPFIFVFAVLATALAAMQVVLTGNELLDSDPGSTLWPFFSWVGVIVAFASLFVGASFATLWVWMVSHEMLYSYRTHRERLARLRAPTYP